MRVRRLILGMLDTNCWLVDGGAGTPVLIVDPGDEPEAVIAEVGREAQVGFHGHQNLSMGIANSVLAYRAGAKQIDGALCALGAGAGNSPTEVLAATFERLGVRTGVDLGEVLSAAGFASQRFRLIAGAGLDVMPRMTDAGYDLVFLDGEKVEYGEYLEQAVRLVQAPGATRKDRKALKTRVDALRSEIVTAFIQEQGEDAHAE